jgi:catechol 2,3-dioxygenase-like lactoylglutathione lyase family enzyme
MPSNLRFDHRALFVHNLDTSAGFYSEILRLKEIENKTKPPSIRWFSLGNGVQLHLIAGDTEGIALMKQIHFALSVPDFDDLLKYLDEKKAEYSDWSGQKRSSNVRADGVRQIYLQDPDGYWIEINDAKHE